MPKLLIDITYLLNCFRLR